MYTVWMYCTPAPVWVVCFCPPTCIGFGIVLFLRTGLLIVYAYIMSGQDILSVPKVYNEISLCFENYFAFSASWYHTCFITETSMILTGFG